jgi:hypothetical protein
MPSRCFFQVTKSEKGASAILLIQLQRVKKVSKIKPITSTNCSSNVIGFVFNAKISGSGGGVLS